MKIPTKEIDNFIKKIPSEIKSILLYGPDSGLVSARHKLIQRNYVLAGKFKYEQVKSNPSIILDSLRNISLFGEDLSKEKIAIIEVAGASIAEPLASIVKESNFKGLMLFLAGDLGPESSLRKTFEKMQKQLASIACYCEDQFAVARIINDSFRRNGIIAEPGLVQQISNSIQLGNHELILREVEKIILFLGDKKHVTFNDLAEFLENQEEVSFDRLSYKLSLKQKGDVENLYYKLRNEGHNPVSIVRFIARHFYRIYQVRILLDQGKSEAYAAETLHPPVFFKQVPDFNKSVKLWNNAQLVNILKKINELELEVKRSPQFANLSFKRLMLEIVM